MPPELTPARRRGRKLWRRIRSVAALLPPTGFQWVRHLLWHGTALPVARPRTLTHHLFLKMARDRNPPLTLTSDKLAMRGFVTERLGPGYLPELYGVLDSPAGLHEIELPPRYVVKATHGSGMTAVVKADDRGARAAIVARAHKWLAYRYWKWLWLGGRASLVQVDFARFTGHTRNFHDPDGAPVALRMYYPPGPDIALPPTFGAMRAVAERLVVGELTHCPTGGNKSFDPPEWDAKLGALWPGPRS